MSSKKTRENTYICVILKTLYPRIRLSNTDPVPGDKLNEDPCETGSETLSIVKLHCTKCAVHIYCSTKEDKGTMSADFVQPQGSIHSKRQKGCGSKYPHIAATRKPKEWFTMPELATRCVFCSFSEYFVVYSYGV
jgi:hypothetical protein